MTNDVDPLDSSETSNWWAWMMIVFSIVFLVGYSVLVLDPALPALTITIISIVMVAIWLLFIVEFVLAYRRARTGWKFVSKHWLVSLSLLLPVVRPFLLLRYINQLPYFKKRSGTSVRLKISITALSFAALFIYMLALTVLRFERDAPGANIQSFGDAIWWAFVTIATVGYGDYYPVTVPGRFFAVILMMGGVAIVGTASALVVSYLGEQTKQAIQAHREAGSGEKDSSDNII